MKYSFNKWQPSYIKFVLVIIAFISNCVLLGCDSSTTITEISKPVDINSNDEKVSSTSTSANSSNKNIENIGITDTEILIGSCAALEGPANFLGTQTVLGAKTYINYINDQGGVNGRKIKLVSYDDSYEPTKAIDCFKELVEEKVFAAGFFVGSPTAAKHVVLAANNQIPIVGLFTGAQFLHEPFKPYIINVRASYYDETQAQINNLWNVLGIRKIAVIYQEDAFGVAVLEGVKLALKKYGSTPIGLSSFQRNTLDVERAISQVRESNPEAVIMVGAYAPLAEIVKRSKNGGFSPLFLTVSFVGTEAFIQAAGKSAEDTIITQVVPSYDDKLSTVMLYRRLLKQYFPKEKENFVNLEGFVDAMVLVEGLKRAGRDLNRTKLIQAIESIRDMDIGLGQKLKLNYGKQDHKGFDSVYYTVVRGGKAVSFEQWQSLKK